MKVDFSGGTLVALPTHGSRYPLRGGFNTAFPSSSSLTFYFYP
jgi:hypothetical protein